MQNSHVSTISPILYKKVFYFTYYRLNITLILIFFFTFAISLILIDMINKDIRVKSALKIVLSVLYAAKELFVSNKRVVILLTLVISVVESVVTDDFDSDQLTASCDNLTYSFHNDFETYG